MRNTHSDRESYILSSLILTEEFFSDLEDVFDHLPGIISISEFKTNKVLWANYNALSILGYTLQEIKALGSRYYLEFFHPDDYGIFKRVHHYFAVEKGTCFRGVYRLKHKNGSWHWFYSTIVIYEQDENDHPYLMLGVAVDISEQNQSGGQLEKLLRENLRLRNQDAIKKLTCRETEVLKLIAAEHTSKAIASLLNISALTVETHRKRIMKKLNLRNMAGLAKFAVQNLI